MRLKGQVNKVIVINTLTVFLGVLIGFAYWHFYSCDHGCAITSSWWKTSGFGGVFGYLIGDSIVEWREKTLK